MKYAARKSKMSWTVTVPEAAPVVQRRGGVLRPLGLSGLGRGALVDVWTAGDQAAAVVVDRDDQPGETTDVGLSGWW